MDIPHQLQSSLSTTSIPTPSLTWLQTQFTATRNPPPPLASLLATARTRLLASDLTTPGLLDTRYTAAHSFPHQLQQSLATTRETKLAQDVVVQVLDIEDVTRSRWEQVEELEAIARGEGTRGREVVRIPMPTPDSSSAEDGDDGTQTPPIQGNGPGQAQQQQQQGTSNRNSTHKLLVQDCKGQTAQAIELKRVDRLAVGKTFIGEKILLRAGTVVARGVVLLDPAQCVVLGGKVDAWHRAWVDGRLARLREAVGAERRG
jgi:RecQ-mediated genome instability protein 1